MKTTNRLSNRVFWGAFLLTVVLIAVWIRYSFYTPVGSKALTAYGLTKVLDSRQVLVNSSAGTLSQGMQLNDLVLHDVRGLPVGTTIKIKSLFFDVHALSVNGLVGKVDNARILLPFSDEPIVVFGTLNDGQIDLNLFASTLSIHELDLMGVNDQLLRRVQGTLSGVDVFVRGPYRQPEVTGGFLVQDLSYKNFHLQNCRIEPIVKIQPGKKHLQMVGRVVTKGGQLTSRNTTLQLEDCHFDFSGDIQDPALDIVASSVIDTTKIRIRVRGKISKPDVQLSSQPPLPQTQLMVMLATGQGWKGVENSLNTGTISPDVGKEFVDYFFFGGQGSKFARQLGIRDFSIILEKDKKGFGIKKELTNNLEVGYDLEQIGTGAVETRKVKQTIGGEVKLTDKVSIGAEKEVLTANPADATAPISPAPQIPDDKVYLRYKTAF